MSKNSCNLKLEKKKDKNPSNKKKDLIAKNVPSKV